MHPACTWRYGSSGRWRPQCLETHVFFALAIHFAVVGAAKSFTAISHTL